MTKPLPPQPLPSEGGSYTLENGALVPARPEPEKPARQPDEKEG